MFIRFLRIFRDFMRLTTVVVSATIKSQNAKEGTPMTQLLCLGDSITDCCRLFFPNPLGNGYVKELSRMLSDTSQNFSVINKGIDGLTLEKLLHHAPSWLQATDPDIITVLIGINDIGIMMNTRRTSGQQQLLMQKFSEQYEQLARLLSDRKNTGARYRRLFFLEPFIFSCPQYYAAWKPLLLQMSGQIQKISQKHGAVFVPLQDALAQEASRSGADSITTDGIHLTPRGHQILAGKLYSSITSER